MIKDSYWIDGRPVYWKTFRSSTGSETGVSHASCSTNIQNMDTLIQLNSFVKNSSGAFLVESSLSYVNIGQFSYSGFSVWIDSGTATICEQHHVQASNNRTFYTTLMYTKSTDPENTEISGDFYSSNNKGEEMAIYSLDERKTSKYWIDKKPIYRKTVNVTTSNVVDTNNQLVNLSSLKIAALISLTGCYVTPDSNIPVNFPVLTDERSIMTWINANGYLSERHISSSMNGISGHVTIEYTKAS